MLLLCCVCVSWAEYQQLEKGLHCTSPLFFGTPARKWRLNIWQRNFWHLQNPTQTYYTSYFCLSQLHPHNTFNMPHSPTMHPYLLFCRGNTHWFVQIRVRFVFVICKNLCWFCCCCCQAYFNGSALMVHSSSGSVTKLVGRDFSFLDFVDFLCILYFCKESVQLWILDGLSPAW